MSEWLLAPRRRLLAAVPRIVRRVIVGRRCELGLGSQPMIDISAVGFPLAFPYSVGVLSHALPNCFTRRLSLVYSHHESSLG